MMNPGIPEPTLGRFEGGSNDVVGLRLGQPALPVKDARILPDRAIFPDPVAPQGSTGARI